MEQLYGDSSARNAVFAESATQLQLEAAAHDAAGRDSLQPAAQAGCRVPYFLYTLWTVIRRQNTSTHGFNAIAADGAPS